VGTRNATQVRTHTQKYLLRKAEWDQRHNVDAELAEKISEKQRREFQQPTPMQRSNQIMQMDAAPSPAMLQHGLERDAVFFNAAQNAVAHSLAMATHTAPAFQGLPGTMPGMQGMNLAFGASMGQGLVAFPGMPTLVPNTSAMTSNTPLVPFTSAVGAAGNTSTTGLVPLAPSSGPMAGMQMQLPTVSGANALGSTEALQVATGMLPPNSTAPVAGQGYRVVDETRRIAAVHPQNNLMNVAAPGITPTPPGSSLPAAPPDVVQLQ